MTEANKEVVRRAWAAYDRGDEDAFFACLSPDWVEHEPDGVLTTVEDERGAIATQGAGFPDKHSSIELIISEGEWVCTRTVTTATHTQPYRDLAPTGKTVSFHEISLHRVVDGRIIETWVEFGPAGFYKQLTGHDAPSHTDNMG